MFHTGADRETTKSSTVAAKMRNVPIWNPEAIFKIVAGEEVAAKSVDEEEEGGVKNEGGQTRRALYIPKLRVSTPRHRD